MYLQPWKSLLQQTHTPVYRLLLFRAVSYDRKSAFNIHFSDPEPRQRHREIRTPQCKLRWLAMAAATQFPEAAVTVFMVSSTNLGVRAHQCYSKTFPIMARQGLLYPRLALSYVSSWRWPCPGEPLYLVYAVLREEPRTSYTLGKHSSNWIPSSQIGSTLWFWSVTGYLFSKCKQGLTNKSSQNSPGCFQFHPGKTSDQAPRHRFWMTWLRSF